MAYGQGNSGFGTAARVIFAVVSFIVAFAVIRGLGYLVAGLIIWLAAVVGAGVLAYTVWEVTGSRRELRNSPLRRLRR